MATVIPVSTTMLRETVAVIRLVKFSVEQQSANVEKDYVLVDVFVTLEQFRIEERFVAGNENIEPDGDGYASCVSTWVSLCAQAFEDLPEAQIFAVTRSGMAMYFSQRGPRCDQRRVMKTMYAA